MIQCATITNDVQAIQNCPPTESSRFSERLRFRINMGPAIQITDQGSQATQDNHRFMEDRIIRNCPWNNEDVSQQQAERRKSVLHKFGPRLGHPHLRHMVERASKLDEQIPG
jgi:hypothetical protein